MANHPNRSSQNLKLETEHGAVYARPGATMQGSKCYRVSRRAARKLGTRDASRLPQIAGYGEWIGTHDSDDFVCYAQLTPDGASRA